MRKLLVIFLLFTFSEISFAGDAAAFKDLGFSNDGKIYIFAQYGKTDKKFRPYAEIYAIDVERNEYVPGGVFKNLEIASDRSGKQVYDELYEASYSALKKYNCATTSLENTIYALESEIKKDTDEIVFKNWGDDTEKVEGLQYSVRLVPTYNGYGQNCLSSFYIDLVLESNSPVSKTPVKRYKVGSPDIKRKSVTAYKIVRIMRDVERTSLVFVVEKTIENETGTSIRYMVETIKL